MDYKDTIINIEDMNWGEVKFKILKDGINDLNICIPFTEILEAQAKNSFLLGIKAVLDFATENGDKPDQAKIMLDQLINWGFNVTQKGEESNEV